eukprot:g2623.t1
MFKFCLFTVKVCLFTFLFFSTPVNTSDSDICSENSSSLLRKDVDIVNWSDEKDALPNFDQYLKPVLFKNNKLVKDLLKGGTFEINSLRRIAKKSKTINSWGLFLNYQPKRKLKEGNSYLFTYHNEDKVQNVDNFVLGYKTSKRLFFNDAFDLMTKNADKHVFKASFPLPKDLLKRKLMPGFVNKNIKRKLNVDKIDMEIEQFGQLSKGFTGNIWFSTQNATTTFHYDSEHNIYIQLSGSKRFLMASPKDVKNMYLHPILHPFFRQSKIRNIETHSEFPLFKDVEVIEAIVEPGDILYMPAMWFHNVKAVSSELSTSLNFWSESACLAPIKELIKQKNPFDGELFDRDVSLSTEVMRIVAKKSMEVYVQSLLLSLWDNNTEKVIEVLHSILETTYDVKDFNNMESSSFCRKHSSCFIKNENESENERLASSIFDRVLVELTVESQVEELKTPFQKKCWSRYDAIISHLIVEFSVNDLVDSMESCQYIKNCLLLPLQKTK